MYEMFKVRDQVVNILTGQSIPIPEWARTSYRKLCLWLMANNYSVPQDMQDKASTEQPLDRWKLS